MEGGFSSVDQNQDDVNYKSDMSFEPIDLGVMTHRLRLGGELGYKNVGREVVSDYYYTTQGTINNIGLIDTNGNCDNASSIFGMSLCVMGSLTNPNSNATGKVGQYAKTLNVIPAGGLRLDTFAYGIYLEDDMRLDLSSAGEGNMRFGLRFDGDDYMEKHTIAPRFSLNYVAPWKEEYKSTLILGANRYYGRNLFSYRLYDSILAATKQYTRTSQNSVWIESSVNISSSFRFDKLNVPYADELMIGLSQNFWAFNATLKYIHREGKDEIMRRSRSHSDTNPPALSGYSNTYNYYTNDGSSRSDIITFMLTNIVPLETFGVRHQYLLAFDWTNTKRSYNLFAADEAYADNEMVVYNGQIIPYRDRPTENFALPYTLRLNTTHTFNIWRTRWLWNNFFRYRAGYERVVMLTRNSAGYDQSLSTYTQYGTMKFNGAFTWDMRVGFEVNVWKGNTLFMNLDIYNVLNAQNMTSVSLASGGVSTAVGASATMPVYEVGRQFWLQVGYRY